MPASGWTLAVEESALPEATQETYGKADQRGMIPKRRSTEERLAIVETRRRIGDGGADTIIGKNHQQAIVSMVERKTGLTLIENEHKTARAVGEAMIRLLKPHRRRVHTATSDNGREFAGHEAIAQHMQADFYSGSAARTRTPTK